VFIPPTHSPITESLHAGPPARVQLSAFFSQLTLSRRVDQPEQSHGFDEPRHAHIAAPAAYSLGTSANSSACTMICASELISRNCCTSRRLLVPLSTVFGSVLMMISALPTPACTSVSRWLTSP